VLAAALDIVDREGLSALGFRRLAAELGVTTMAPYSHFSSKEDLLEAMTTHVLGGLEDTLDPSAPWDAQVEQAMRDLHAALTRHPGVVDLIVARAEGDRLNELRDVLLAVMRAAGLDETESADVLLALVSYVLGFVVLRRCRAPVKVRRGSEHAFEYGLSMLIDSLRRRAPQPR
jgi:AcrR family transcriptional regulator